MRSVILIPAGLSLLAMVLTGCTAQTPFSGGPRLVPQNAQLVADGVPPITYLWSQPGTIYIVDREQNALIHSGFLDADPELPFLLVVDPVDKAVVIQDIEGEEKYLLIRQIDPAHRFAIWFVPRQAAAGEQRRR